MSKAKASGASARTEYLAQPSVQAFCKYLVAVVKGETRIEHAYTIKWKQWKKVLGQQTITFDTLESAYRNYYWPTNSQVADDGGDNDASGYVKETDVSIPHDWTANAERLRKLRDEISTAMAEQPVNEQKVFIAALKILDWGQVYKGCAGWLIQEFERGCLSKKLARGAQILDGQGSDVTEFQDNKPLRMDSGLTKIYSLCSKRSIIYDDRVGAAMGLLVRSFLDLQKKDWCPSGQNKIPRELRFMRGPTKTRNASVKKKYAFPGKKTGSEHAKSNLWANWVIQEVVKDIGFWDYEATADLASKMRIVEGALFMLGYRVNALNYSIAAS